MCLQTRLILTLSFRWSDKRSARAKRSTASIQVNKQNQKKENCMFIFVLDFNERFKFYVSESYASVDVCVFDSTMLIQDYFLGKVEVLVRSLSVDVPVEKWYALQPLHHGGKAVGGEILLKLLLTRE
jgi:hypothetical protein